MNPIIYVVLAAVGYLVALALYTMHRDSKEEQED